MQSTPSQALDPQLDLAVEALNLVRRFGSVVALENVSLAVGAGEFFALLGPSGCGKTTLLRIIAGLEIPDSGSLRLCGTDASPIPANRRPVNTVFQSYALFPHLTVRDNVAFGLRMKRLPKADIERKVDRILDLVQISELSQRMPAQLSGGQKQRVALARAVVNEPRVLLLDEPLGALDLKLRKELQVELRNLQRRLGTTFIYVTHDQEEALSMSDRIAVMHQGRIEQTASARDLYERPRTTFVARFLGSCNILRGTISEVAQQTTTIETELGVVSSASAARASAPSGRSTSLAIRPERILLSEQNSVAPANMNRIRGRVRDSTYNGPETRYEVEVSNAGILTAVMLNSAGRSFQPGQAVDCTFAPDSVVILED